MAMKENSKNSFNICLFATFSINTDTLVDIRLAYTSNYDIDWYILFSTMRTKIYPITIDISRSLLSLSSLLFCSLFKRSNNHFKTMFIKDRSYRTLKQINSPVTRNSFTRLFPTNVPTTVCTGGTFVVEYFKDRFKLAKIIRPAGKDSKDDFHAHVPPGLRNCFRRILPSNELMLIE